MPILALNTALPDNQCWYLEGYADDKKAVRRIPVKPVPFVVGRKADLPLPLNFAAISRMHAELYFESGTLWVRDLESRNGTFVNRERITVPTALQPGDIVHFGTCEFRVGSEEDAGTNDFGETCEFQGILPEQFISGTKEFLEMLRLKAVAPFFQPLVMFNDRSIFAYELLGRGCMPGAPTTPGELFALAASVSMEGELSRLFRHAGVHAALSLPGSFELFVNVHPIEMKNLSGLIASFKEVRLVLPTLNLTVEIHESLVTNPETMLELRTAFSDMGLKLAYDDFGAGQARLIELAEVPPDYLKFDRSLIHGIESAPKQRQQMVEMLVRYSHDLGVATLAEGIETEEEARVCHQMGFVCGQGYYFGRPAACTEMTSGL